ncbi:FUSC family protein [Catenulispora subtropica]|uniref:FUSC family protein n=1 Tax=Catenulispora subtropica TaxID=450798 RepID=A0ABN2RWF1_9ACTN
MSENPIGRSVAWLRRRDPQLAATRRAARTALVMPSLFALCAQVLHAPVTGTFAAFGSFAMLLLVDFAGPRGQRLRAHAALGVAWLVLVTLGTVAAQTVWSAAVLTVVIGFAVLFSGVVSSVLAGATTALLLGFILPVSAAAPLSQLPDRLTGVLMATGASMLAVSVLWPRTPVHPLTAPAAAVCRAAARQLRADADHYSGRTAAPTFAQCLSCADETDAATRRLQQAFTATPYRPTGLSTGSRALVRMVDQLTWLSAILVEAVPAEQDGEAGQPESSAVRDAAARVLDLAADMLENPGVGPERLRAETADLRQSLAKLEDGAVSLLPVVGGAGLAGHDHGGRAGHRGHEHDGTVDAEVACFLGTLDVSFRAQEVAFVVLQLADAVDLARSADRRSWPDRLLGRDPGSSAGAFASARERAAAHVERHSVWLHNSIRGAVGLGIAVVVANVTGVQHAFWVMLGTLSVLRSNALNTGQNAFRALGGTIAGSILGAGLLEITGQDRALLWALLPFAVLLAGIIPSAISFAAGQAAFTVTLVILFNIAQPAGLSVILFRIEDIALGCAVSLVVGLFFWPRGAAAAVSKALAEAYTDSARYLVGAVDFAVSCCTFGRSATEVPPESRQAAAAARRLDDAFRTYLAERGPKTVPLGELTTLVTGVVGLRLAADAVLELWRRSVDDRPSQDRAAAQRELLIMAERVQRWYQSLADGLDDRGPVPEPAPADRQSTGRLVEAVRHDLQDEDGNATATGVRIIWTGDHLEAVRRLQSSLAMAATDADGRLRLAAAGTG